MTHRLFVAFLLSTSILSAGAWGQNTPPATAPASAKAPDFKREVQGLSAEDYADREAALKRLQGLVAEQLKQRAQIQEVINTFQADLVKQQQTLAMVTDEEAQAQIAGLLEMERGLTSWTIQTMSESAERRKALLNWGLTKESAPILARAYAETLRIRIEGIKQLAKLNDAGADWTLGRMINDRQAAIRAASMAVCWSRKPGTDIVNALWFRAITGPMSHHDHMSGPMMGFEGNMGMAGIAMAVAVDDIDMEMPDINNTIKVDFPGGEPMEFSDYNDAVDFYDAPLAADVLVHLKAPLVGEKIKALVEERVKAGKSLSLNYNPEWTLVSHRLIETYAVKEAIPLLAAEALGADAEEMGGDMDGRPFMWSRRTMAIGVLAKLIGKDPADFDLIKAHDMGNSRGWTWAVDINPQAMGMGMGNGESDGAAVRAFYAYWKDHYSEYGIKEKPSGANVPAVPQPGQMPRRFRGVMPPGIDGPVQILPAPANGAEPDVMPGAPAPDVAPNNAPGQTPPMPPTVRPMPLMRGAAAG